MQSDVLPFREAQIGKGKTAEEKWEFATNWSLPPEEILEFIAPSVYGYETTNLEGPYWGRLGRSLDWTLENRQGFMNFRQHTVYVGAISVFFALYALFWAIFSKGADLRNLRGPIVFWSVIAFVATLFSFGRYFPVYRLFYALPGCSSIRCPVKFVHFVEFAISALFAFGLVLFCRHIGILGKKPEEPNKKKKDKKQEPSEEQNEERARVTQVSKRLTGFMIFALVAGGILWLSAAMAGNASTREYWGQLGLGGYAEAMSKTMKVGLFHGGLLFVVAGGLLAAIRYGNRSGGAAKWVMPALMIVVAVDVIVVCKPFVHTRDLAVYYADNPIAEVMNKQKVPGRLAYYYGRSKMDPLFRNMLHHNIEIIDPRQDKQPPQEYQEYMANFQPNLLIRFWQLTNTRFVAGPKNNPVIQQLLQHPQLKNQFKPMIEYNVGRA
ncbi:MAG: hypothetical protein AAF492_22520, partial [Verrucomicrobiota bacterium]